MGMNNPVSTLPGYELYPLPEGCSGHRLWRMLSERTGATMRQYRDTFDRTNLVRGQDYDGTRARARAHELTIALENSGRTVVLLGQAVRAAFGHPRLLVHPQEIGGCTWRQVPHPSGRCLWYNDAENRKVVAMLLEELYVEYHRKMETWT